MKKGQMLSKQTQDTHLGDRLRYKPEYFKLAEVEDYLLDKCAELGVDCSHDCMANEPFKFKTINYTTYAGVMIIHPLQPELTRYQLIDALMDTSRPIKPFSEFFMTRMMSDPNKYNFTKRAEVTTPCSELMILPGSNKLHTHVCIERVKQIVRDYPNVVIKPHPLTNTVSLNSLQQALPDANIADYNTDLYQLLRTAQRVFTTHMSESALYAKLLNKAVEPIDTIQTRVEASFSHINYHIFMTDSVDWVDQVFSSPYSGVVHPSVDLDWQAKVDEYLSYVLAKRERVKSFYWGH